MANIASTDVTYVINVKDRTNRSHRMVNVTLTFGDGALTYPAGGVPILKASLGCPNVIERLVIFDMGGSGYNWVYDKVNAKLIAYQAPSHTHDILLKNATQADGATTRVNAAANKLGANTGGDLTVTGGGANGGVVSVAAGVLTEPSAVAIAAQTLQVEVIGW